MTNQQWPKIKDLPKEEQEPFWEWLTGQTIPMNEDNPEEKCYFQWDYDRWKAGLPVID